MMVATANSSGDKRSRLTLVLIFALFLLPFLGAWVMNFFGDFAPEATTNHGALVQPVLPIHATGLIDVQDKVLDSEYFQGKWTLVYPLAGDCDDVCHQVLYVLRQVRLAQGKNIDRVQRLFLLQTASTPDWVAEVRQHYPGLTVVRPAGAEVASEFPAPGRIYLVDPLGNLMMEYAVDVDARGMVKDLERLLRISYVG